MLARSSARSARAGGIPSAPVRTGEKELPSCQSRMTASSFLGIGPFATPGAASINQVAIASEPAARHLRVQRSRAGAPSPPVRPAAGTGWRRPTTSPRPRHHQRRRARAGYLAGGNTAPQHHHHPLQLPHARGRALLRRDRSGSSRTSRPTSTSTSSTPTRGHLTLAHTDAALRTAAGAPRSTSTWASIRA